MAYSKRVIFTFTPSWKAAKSPVFSVCKKFIAPACKDLMSIGLVSHVPNQLIIGRVENVMKRNCQLNHTQACPKMTAVNTDNINNILTQLIRKLVKLFSRKFPQVCGV